MRIRDIVLVVDDSAVSRDLLTKILEPDYTVWQAESGQRALELLAENPVAAVILDLVMPEMNGYEVLNNLHATPALAALPVLVATGSTDRESERLALEHGAWDFIYKPYDPPVIRMRLHNAITRSQPRAVQELAYLAQYDPLTGVYNKQRFFSETRRMLALHPEIDFVFIRFDIEQFKLVNTLFGAPTGDKLLRYAGDTVRTMAQGLQPCTFGRAESDIFCLCIPYDKNELLSRMECARQALADFSSEFYLKPSFGLYRVEAPRDDVEKMYTKATLAAQECKSEYRHTFAFYRPDMAQKALADRQILNDLKPALEQEQFVIYYQPKVTTRTQRCDGAEALVRWQHPQRGLIAPGAFIGQLEKNGLITELDTYVWEKVCAQLHDWITQGLDPAPISVNISRVTMYMPQLAETICALVEKYGIPPRLLHLEITESAYIDSTRNAIDKLRRLHEKGFMILMDDFGTGYSSLNMLKDLPVDTLKIDIGFLSSSRISKKSEIILSAIVKMARELHISVVAEGVETYEQFRFYKRIGCDAIQGYYFSKPVPAEDYTALRTAMNTRHLFAKLHR